MTSDVPPKVKAGYTNPAFRAMGIPPLRLPSRNWMIFWSIVTVSVSGIVYDKQKQKQIRNNYQDIVKPLADRPIDVNVKPRKITVFIAPPPNDYLDTSLKVWRRYVKPILYYAGVDYEIVQEEKQGVIRTEVASRIRAIRRQYLASHVKQQTQNEIPPDEYNPDQAKQFKAEFDYRNAIGPFHGKPKPEIIHEDSLTTPVELSGGVICLGRGAYKEYITGLHEGLLGPIDLPEEDKSNLEISGQDVGNKPMGSKVIEANIDSTENTEVEKSLDDETPQNQDSLSENEVAFDPEEEKEDKRYKDPKISKPFITPDEYGNAELSPELSLSGRGSFVRDPITNVPILLHQAVLTIPIPNLIGFLNIPERIYRFYQKRYYCESVCSAVTDLVETKDVRPFGHPGDLELAIEEEDDWPKGWVKEGMKRKSEWTTKLSGDMRVLEHINLYNKENKK